MVEYWRYPAKNEGFRWSADAEGRDPQGTTFVGCHVRSL